MRNTLCVNAFAKPCPIHAQSIPFAAADVSPVKPTTASVFSANAAVRMRRPEGWRVWEAVKALALCHNVTPVYDATTTTTTTSTSSGDETTAKTRAGTPSKSTATEASSTALDIEQPQRNADDSGLNGSSSAASSDVTYQASSPDEIALVTWTEQIGLALVARDLNLITLQMRPAFSGEKQPQPPQQQAADASSQHESSSINTVVTALSLDSKTDGALASPSSSSSSSSGGSESNESLATATEHNQMRFHILQMFPFTSESKRMGIIVKDAKSGEITFYMKGADVVMATIVQYNDWLNEESGNMAREGLRTLVVAKKMLTEDQYNDFEMRYNAARLSLTDRIAKVAAVIESLERDMELLCLTGVEDRLQDRVRPTLELLRNAGIKIWMLTGDKLETATCIAKSSHLVGRNQGLHVLKSVLTR